MKNIVIIGAGGFGREVQWLIERINIKINRYKILGYIDDNVEIGKNINGYEVIGNTDLLKYTNKELSVVCAIGNADVRMNIINKIKENKNLEFPNLIDPSVCISQFVNFGEGNIICAQSILTVNINIKDFCIINLDCTIGHDVVLESYTTVYPSVNVSGNVIVGKNSEIGTGTQIIQNCNIGEKTIIGAGAVVVNDIPENSVAVGTPCKVIKKRG